MQKKKSSSWRNIFVKTFIVLALLIGASIISEIFYASSNQSYYEKKQSIEQIENSEPLRFLTTDGNYRESFWGTKIKVFGKVTNQATIASYKDVVIRITYYSKTKTILGSKDYTLYEVFPPNMDKTFELKIDNFKDVNSIGWDVISAIPN